jgi:hypothetical protein
VSHVLEESWQEQRERLHGNVDCKEAERTHGVVDVEDSALDVHKLDFLVDVCTVLAEQALSGDLLFCFESATVLGNHLASFKLTTGREELALVRVGLHEKGSDKSNDASKESFEEEDVTPGVQSHRRHAEFGDSDKSSSQQATECTCERTGRDENTDAEEQFVSLVKA